MQPTPSHRRPGNRRKPPPPAFAELFTRVGWRGVEAAFGARTVCNRRWIEECGGAVPRAQGLSPAVAGSPRQVCGLMLVDSRFFEARFPGSRVVFELADGRAVEAPMEWFPLLQAAPKEARARYEIEDDGRTITWPALGERVSVEAVLLVRFPGGE